MTTSRTTQVVVGLSLALLFFALPHTLEDFSLGEPLKRGVPPPVIAGVVSLLVAVQGLGLYWIGRGRRLGIAVHGVLGVLWTVAAGAAQLGEILGAEPYRSGSISVAYVVGTIAVGALLAVASVNAFRHGGRV
jgi:hypothetical protein